MCFTLPTKTYSLPDGSTPISKPSKVARVVKRNAEKSEQADEIAKAAKKRAKAKLRGEVTDAMRVAIIARDLGICMLCLQPTTQDDPPHVDHVRPAAAFPMTCESNLACLHASCNIAKGARPDAIPVILRNMADADERRHRDPKNERTPEQLSAAYDWRNKKDKEVQGVVEGVKKGKVK